LSGLYGAIPDPGDVREDRADRLKSDLLRCLGHPARVRLLELLGDSERSVGDLQTALDLGSSAASRHLAALRRQGLLESRKSGTSVLCRVKDRRTLKLLSLAREILVANLEDNGVLLGELTTEPTEGRPDPLADSRVVAARQARGRGR
jgi:DNA-binding transcriptional ArsR family regulator